MTILALSLSKYSTYNFKMYDSYFAYMCAGWSETNFQYILKKKSKNLS
jgi:hypothetical protein